jgi:DNA-binding CsgD family transcriptional regulator
MQNVPPHTRWAIPFSDLPSRDETVTVLLESMIAQAGFGLALVTADRKVIYANDLANVFMQRESGLRWERGCISATDFKTSRELQSLILAALRKPHEPRQGTLLVIRDRNGVASLAVHAVPVCRPSLPDPCSLELRIAGLLMVDCQQGAASRINAFAKHFGLTPAEARVLIEVVSGGGISRAAVQLNIASSTVHTHLSRILEKTGTHRQVELVRIFHDITLLYLAFSPREHKRPAAFGNNLAVKCA